MPAASPTNSALTTCLAPGTIVETGSDDGRFMAVRGPIALRHLRFRRIIPRRSLKKIFSIKKTDEASATVIVEGPLEPSHALLELCANQYQANQLQYIKPQKCTSRMREITTGKPSTKELQLKANKLVVRENVEVSEMTIHNSLLLQEAFKRCGLAYVFSNSVSHAAYERYLQTLFMHTSREPPPGCQRCSLSQLVQADRMVFIRLIEENVKPRRKPNRWNVSNGPCTDSSIACELHADAVARQGSWKAVC